MIEEFKIIKVTEDEVIETLDKVVVEKPLTIFVNEKEYITIMCTPMNLKDLGVGFLFSEGLIKTKEDIESMILETKEENTFKVKLKDKIDFERVYGNRVVTSGSKGSLFLESMDFMQNKKFENKLKIHKKEIMDTMKSFFKRSEIFEFTGGVHSVLLKSSKDEIFREDIGRHNAIDKAVGYLILNSLNVEEFVMYVSGRLSSEMVSKISKANICCAISRACPTTLSLKSARDMNMTLIGFSRGNRFNIYSGEERVDLND